MKGAKQIIGALSPIYSEYPRMGQKIMGLILLEARILVDTPALFLVIFRIDKPEF
ncbi:MAG: hypothetical protein N0C84_06650 [Candidatus Thiodiazotropha taylori]|uniref:Uncharacterized protein n=1 Tax=Candidatus Thiodiazotropha taylori TaxID=2792791 RepID=A0A9E4N2U1_9GAMM|nr:hypothetical protein [Candidatus Thiodiazotropha taylori]MCW4256135.1 hypothetical protein [Candidatus Thiodiazotropha taylori]